MALLVPNVGEQEMLRRILNALSVDDVRIHLYSDNVTPAEADTIASYTLVTSPSAVSLDGESWDTTSVVGTASYAQQTFTYSGTGTAYGYVVTNDDGTILLWAERFTDGPYEIPSGGGTIKITPSISLD